MKFLIIHNPYSNRGGEESVVEAQASILRGHGHSVIVYERPYDQIKGWRFGRLSSLFSSLYNRRSVCEIRRIAKSEKPDFALIHNLFPVVSPAILPVLKKCGVRSIMSLHNFRLVCPTGLFFRAGSVCELCGTSKLREWNCTLHQCQGSALGSFAYALRSFWARKKGYYTKNIDLFCALSEFQRAKMAQFRIDAQRVAVLPNPVEIPNTKAPVERGEFVGFVGRLTVEKGAELLFQVARMMPTVKFKVAGDVIASTEHIPQNVELLGFLDREALENFYFTARIVISTSICRETFGLVVAEAMVRGAAVIVPQIAAMPELVDHGQAGIVYPAGDAKELCRAIETLLNDQSVFESLTSCAAIHIKEHYSNEIYYDRLIDLCRKIRA